MAQVAARLGVDKPAATVITVAGTNGKGSCVRTMEALLTAQSLATGAFTSPHLLAFNERIRVNGVNASDGEICQAFAAIESARQDISLTYFEFAALAALYIFQQQDLDYWLLEVGLGGRLDAVNIVDADLAVITSIDLDHQAWLGDTREAIAGEKAGILRNKIPCVVAEPAPPASLLKIIRSLQCQHFQYGKAFDLSPAGQLRLSLDSATGDVAGAPQRFTLAGLRPGLPLHSVAAGCQALAIVNCLPLPEMLRSILNNVTLAGRFQVETWQGLRVVLDVAHNPAASRLLAAKLEHFRQRNATYFVTAIVGMMQDKDIEGCFAPLISQIAHWILAELPTARAATPQQMRQALQRLGVAQTQVQTAHSAEHAFRLAQIHGETAQGAQSPLLLVAGSFHTVAKGLAFIDANR